VTMEDVVEELVGDIRDEYDESEPASVRSLTGEIDVDGLLNLDDFEDETTIALPDGPYETVGGYLMRQLGRVPSAGDTVIHDGHLLTVSAVDGRRVSRVTVSPKAQPAREPGEAGASRPPAKGSVAGRGPNGS
jgi:putative hemolysin